MEENVTQILNAIESGEQGAAEELLPVLYTELRRLAAQKLAREAPGHTLQPTALVHEAYLRLLGPGGQGRQWDGRGHFFAAAAEAMRRILIESARKKRSLKRGGDRVRVELTDAAAVAEATPDTFLAVNEALGRLEKLDPENAQLVKLRFFAGLKLKEAGALLGVSEATAKRRWAFAKAWLQRELARE